MSREYILDPRAVLSRPSVYRAFQRMVGAHRQRTICVDEYIRPVEGERVLDCGCGPGDFLAYFPEVEYVGIDMDQAYIAEARRTYGNRGQFRLGAVGPDTVTETGYYDLVLAWGLLHHLNDDQLTDFLVRAREALKPCGRFVSLDGCYHDGQSRAARWFLQRDRGRFVRSLEVWRESLERVFPQVEINLRQDLLRIPYSQIVVVARPTDLS